MEAPEKVTIVGTAQLTNIALLLIVFPEIKQKIEQIVLLGGAIGLGNISPNAEWNILWYVLLSFFISGFLFSKISNFLFLQ